MQTQFPTVITTKNSKEGIVAYLEHGVLRWASNNRVPPEEILGHCVSTGQIDVHCYELSVKAAKIDLDRFLADRDTWLATAEGDRAMREMRMMARYA